MGIFLATRDDRTLIAAASLIVGPLLMTIGDLFHPEERMDTPEQSAILVDHASRPVPCRLKKGECGEQVDWPHQRLINRYGQDLSYR